MPTPFWVGGVLQGLHVPLVADNKKLLMGWWQWEGGNGGVKGNIHPSAKFNWLNSMTPMPGSTPFNDVGVQNYPTWRVGVDGTVRTMNQGKYVGLRHAMQNGKPFAVADRQGLRESLSTWVSGTPDGNLAYADRVIKTAMAWVL